MLNREACERRVYRLATLLTGNPNAATKVIAQVLDAQPELSHLDSAHMDRLTVLRSREIAPAALVHDRVPQTLSKALAGLSPQQREAWIFTHVYHAPDREIARAMDCSNTATQRHLEQAEAAMQTALGPESVGLAAKTILEYSMSQDVPRFYRVQRIRSKNLRIALIAMAAAFLALLIAAAALWWSRPLDGR